MQAATIMNKSTVSKSRSRRWGGAMEEAPEEDCHERTGESKQDDRSGRTREAKQQNGLAADVIGQTIPVER